MLALDKKQSRTLMDVLLKFTVCLHEARLMSRMKYPEKSSGSKIESCKIVKCKVVQVATDLRCLGKRQTQEKHK